MTSSIHTLALCILALVSPGGITQDHFARAPMGAQHRAASLATTFTIAADANGLDVALLTALAFWESGFDDRAVSRNGSFGIMQLNPRFHRETVGFCRAHPELCSVAVINRGAQVLALHKRRCRTYQRAVYAYRHGSCGPLVANTLKVMRTRDWIARRIGKVST